MERNSSTACCYFTCALSVARPFVSSGTTIPSLPILLRYWYYAFCGVVAANSGHVQILCSSLDIWLGIRIHLNLITTHLKQAYRTGPRTSSANLDSSTVWLTAIYCDNSIREEDGGDISTASTNGKGI